MSLRSPRELIALYWEQVWNCGQVELIRELCADPMVRHYPGRLEVLDHDRQVARVRHLVAEMQPHFTHEVLLADEHHACSVWNMTSPMEKYARLSSIECFRVENGRLAHSWNATNAWVHWGRSGEGA